MKIKLQVHENKYDAIARELRALGIELDDDADLVLSEKDDFPDYLMVKDKDGLCRLPTDDIIFIESFSHDIIVHATTGDYRCSERLRGLEGTLDPDRFLRVSNSMIIAIDRVRRIRPTLFCKYILTMDGGAEVHVTRSYYFIFKEKFRI